MGTANLNLKDHNPPFAIDMTGYGCPTVKVEAWVSYGTLYINLKLEEEETLVDMTRYCLGESEVIFDDLRTGSSTLSLTMRLPDEVS